MAAIPLVTKMGSSRSRPTINHEDKIDIPMKNLRRMGVGKVVKLHKTASEGYVYDSAIVTYKYVCLVPECGLVTLILDKLREETKDYIVVKVRTIIVTRR